MLVVKVMHSVPRNKTNQSLKAENPNVPRKRGKWKWVKRKTGTESGKLKWKNWKWSSESKIIIASDSTME